MQFAIVCQTLYKYSYFLAYKDFFFQFHVADSEEFSLQVYQGITILLYVFVNMSFHYTYEFC